MTNFAIYLFLFSRMAFASVFPPHLLCFGLSFVLRKHEKTKSEDIYMCYQHKINFFYQSSIIFLATSLQFRFWGGD